MATLNYTGTNTVKQIIASLKVVLEDYTKSADLPTKVSAFENDSKYQTETEVATSIDTVKKETEQYVTDKITELVGGAPEALDTLKEIADKLGDNDDAVAALTAELAKKANTEDLVEITADEVTAMFNEAFSA